MGMLLQRNRKRRTQDIEDIEDIEEVDETDNIIAGSQPKEVTTSEIEETDEKPKRKPRAKKA